MAIGAGCTLAEGKIISGEAHDGLNSQLYSYKVKLLRLTEP